MSVDHKSEWFCKIYLKQAATGPCALKITKSLYNVCEGIYF